MTVTYQNTVNDLVALYANVLAANRKYQSLRWGLLCGIPLSLWISPVLVDLIGGDPVEPSAYLGKMIGTVTFMFLVWLYYRTHPRRAVKRMLLDKPEPEVFRKHVLKISGTGVTVQLGEKTTAHPWPAFHRITSTPDHIFLYETPTTAHIIPRRDLGGSQFQAATAEVRRHRPLT